MTSRGEEHDFLPEERQQRATADELITDAQDRKRPTAQAGIVRRSSGQRIRADLLRAIKIMAAETGTPQYVLIEEAIEQYLARQRPSS